MTDDPLTQLLQQVARQDRAAFRTLYQQAAPKLTGVLTRMLRDRAEVDDALQDVFIRIWRRASQYDPARGTAMGWLITIARNVALDRLRARPAARGMTTLQADPDQPGDDPIDRLPGPAAHAEDRLEAEAQSRRIIACLGELDAQRAAAVQGAYLQGLSYDDLAARFDVPLNTMRTWLRRSLLRLKECLDR